MLGFYDYTVILTYLGVFASLLGTCFAIYQDYVLAMICLFFSGFCDLFDGMVARTKKNRTELEKQNGIQIDSLSDVVCFGVFPAVVGFCLGINTGFHFVFGIAGAVYVICAIIRLAYFNVTEEVRQKESGGKRKYYEGLPVTCAALVIPVLFCFQGLLGAYFPFVYIGALLLMGICFVLKLKIRKPGIIGSVIFVIIDIVILSVLITLKVKGL